METLKLVTWIILVLITVIQSSVLSQTSSSDSDNSVHVGPYKNGTELRPNNSLVLGGLMNVHRGQDCSVFSPEGFERSLAMAYAVEVVNNNSKLLPGINLCYEMFDTCTDRSTTLQQSLAFLPGRLDGNLLVDMEESAFVGAAFSSNSIAAASITQLFEIPQISYASTAEELSDKSRYPYFFRTLPADGLQTRAIADLAKHFGWTYISIIYTDDEYGRSGNRLLRREIEERHPPPRMMNTTTSTNTTNNTAAPSAEANNTQSCVAFSMRIRLGSTRRDYDDLIQQLVTPPRDRARAVVIFGQLETAEGVLDAWDRYVQGRAADNITSAGVTWIASDGWATTLTPQHHSIARGMLGVYPTTTRSPGFDAWFQSLALDNELNSPWFSEYWEYAFNCTLSRSARRAPCSASIRTLAQQTGYAQNIFVPFTIDAVLAFAHALTAMQEALCGPNATGLCQAMTRAGSNRVDGETLRNFLRNVSFEAESTDILEFDENQAVVGGYTIVNLQQQQVEGDRYAVETIGEWNVDRLDIDDATVQWNTPRGRVPRSVCSLPCHMGEYRLVRDASTECCWECQRCRGSEIGDGVICTTCPRNQRPDDTQSFCMSLPLTSYNWSSPIAIALLIISGIAVVIVSGGLVIYMVYWPTKVIKSTSRELTVVMILGIILCYLMTIPCVAPPNQVTCGFLRVGYPLCFTIFFGALLIKTNRIHRIFNRSKNYLKSPAFISWHSQLVFFGLIILGNMAISLIWLVVEPPHVTSLNKRDEIELRCSYNRFAGPTVENFYILCLVVACGYYAVRTRKVPCDYNETRFISITVLCVLVIWLAYLPIYYSTTELSPDIYITSYIVSGMIIASCVFLFLVAPKFYLLLVKKRTEVLTDLTLAKHSVTLKPATTDLNACSSGHTRTRDLGSTSNGLKQQTEVGMETDDAGVQTVFTLEDWNRVLLPDQSSLCSEIVDNFKTTNTFQNNNYDNNRSNNNGNGNSSSSSSSSSAVQLESTTVLCTTDTRADV